MNRQNEGKQDVARKTLDSILADFNVCEKKELGDFLCNVIDQMSDRPGGSSHHHGYRYGLLIHTAEVVVAARYLQMATGGDREVVTVAAIIHDWGKIYDYDYEIKRESYTPAGTLMLKQYDVVTKRPGFQKAAHIIASYDRWREFKDCADEFHYAVGRCILSHHGQLEWGSVLIPSTPEEWCLHLADMASANAGVVL